MWEVWQWNFGDNWLSQDRKRPEGREEDYKGQEGQQRRGAYRDEPLKTEEGPSEQNSRRASPPLSCLDVLSGTAHNRVEQQESNRSTFHTQGSYMKKVCTGEGRGGERP